MGGGAGVSLSTAPSASRPSGSIFAMPETGDRPLSRFGATRLPQPSAPAGSAASSVSPARSSARATRSPAVLSHISCRRTGLPALTARAGPPFLDGRARSGRPVERCALGLSRVCSGRRRWPNAVAGRRSLLCRGQFMEGIIASLGAERGVGGATGRGRPKRCASSVRSRRPASRSRSSRLHRDRGGVRRRSGAGSSNTGITQHLMQRPRFLTRACAPLSSKKDQAPRWQPAKLAERQGRRWSRSISRRIGGGNWHSSQAGKGS